jgi:protein phosphatase 1G
MRHFKDEFIENNNFGSGNFEAVLVETFLKMDELLKSESGRDELRLEARKVKDEDLLFNQNRQVELFKNLFDPRNMEYCEIAMFTGCTACICVISENTIYFANAGDSRAIIAYNGKAYEMTNDHKPELEGEKERIYKADGWISEGRVRGNLNLSRSIGDLEYKSNLKLSPDQQMITSYPDITKRCLNEVDFIVIACDGVWDCKSSQEVVDYIYQRIGIADKLSSITEELFDEILAADVYNSKIAIIQTQG